MKKIILSLLTLLPAFAYSQNRIRIETTESYELSNIILALTQYGRADPWDVQKIPPYYDEVLRYFEPVKNHPLLDSVNYSRQKWQQYLGFRTDMYAFAFDKNGLLKRQYPFNSFGPEEVDKNIDLINDFVVRSGYRQFYREHAAFYQQITSNYKEYYFLDKTRAFLDRITERHPIEAGKKYVIALSPLVGAQNCHREADSFTTVDFPTISKDLIQGNLVQNLSGRLVDNHNVFTEMDHEYVNPISDRHATMIDSHFDLKKWDNGSGYSGINSFNEYMTWAVYDLFLREMLPQLADSISLQWQYQNASRGFIAQNLFARKTAELYLQSKDRKLENIYQPLLEWCRSIAPAISQPTLLHVDKEHFVQTSLQDLSLAFSEPMDTTRSFEMLLSEFKGDQQTGQTQLSTPNHPVWSRDGRSVRFGINTSFDEFALVLNWWGIGRAMYSKNGVLLQPQSYVLLKK